jgi:hypothetical protein
MDLKEVGLKSMECMCISLLQDRDGQWVLTYTVHLKSAWKLVKQLLNFSSWTLLHEVRSLASCSLDSLPLRTKEIHEAWGAPYPSRLRQKYVWYENVKIICIYIILYTHILNCAATLYFTPVSMTKLCNIAVCVFQCKHVLPERASINVP